MSKHRCYKDIADMPPQVDVVDLGFWYPIYIDGIFCRPAEICHYYPKCILRYIQCFIFDQNTVASVSRNHRVTNCHSGIRLFRKPLYS